MDDVLKAELSGYRARKCEPLSSDPLRFWKQNSELYTHLSQQAAKLLNIQDCNFTSVRSANACSVSLAFSSTKRDAVIILKTYRSCCV